MRNLFAPAILLILILASCGKSIDKNSFEGRVASIISDYEGVNVAMSMDLKSIIEKSGVRDGAIPEQYSATIQPFMDALEGSINLERQIFVMPIVDYNNMEGSGAVVLFDVKDGERLKKEFKEMGFSLNKKGDVEFANRDKEAVGIFKGETGFIIMKDGSGKINDQFITDFTKSLSAGATIDGVVDFVNLKSDMTMFFTGDKAQKSAQTGVKELDAVTEKMAEIGKGTYWIGQMSFNNQEAVMTFDVTYGENAKKYMPMMEDEMSKEAKSVIVDENTFAAYAFSLKFEKIISMIIDNLDEKTKEDLNKNMSMLGGLDKFKMMFTGEFAMSMSLGEDSPNMNAFLGIGDKKQVKSLLDGFGFFLGLKKNGDGYIMDDSYLQFTEKGLLFAMNKESLEKMKATKQAKTRDLGGFKFGAAPFSMFADMKVMAKMKGMEDFVDAFKNFDYFTAEMYATNGKVVFKSNRKDQNVLRTLVESFIEMQRLDQIRREEQEREFEEMYGDFDMEQEEFEF